MSKRNRKEVEAIVSGMGVFMAIVSSLVDLIKKFGGTMEMLYRLATPEGNETLERIANLIVNGETEMKKRLTRLISGDENLVIDAVDGTELIVGAKEIFTGGIDSNFINWDVNEKGSATSETPVEVRKMTGDATFLQLFGEINVDVGKICLTQHQIKNFVKKYPDWLRKDGHGTFFLFRSNDHFFVAYVNFYVYDLPHVRVYQFEDDLICNHNLVVPQLA